MSSGIFKDGVEVSDISGDVSVEDLTVSGDLSLTGTDSNLTLENHTETSGNITHIKSTPASESSAIVFKLEASGANWAPGSHVLEIISEDVHARPLTINNGSSDVSGMYQTGGFFSNVGVELTSGGSITSTANGNITINPNGSGIIKLESDVELGTNKIIIETGNIGTEHTAPTELADSASFDLPDATAGFGFLIVGNSEEYAHFAWDSTGTVDLIANSANVVNTDTNTKFCIFDNGTTVRVRNRLGSAKKVVFDYHYTTP